MSADDVVCTRHGDTTTVELRTGATTAANYANVRRRSAGTGVGFAWSLASGQHGTETTERRAIDAAASALRERELRRDEGQEPRLRHALPDTWKR